jgi:hypothetical protein
VTIARVSGSGCQVLAHAWDRTVGCESLDRALYRHFLLPAAAASTAKAGKGTGKGKEKEKEKKGGGGGGGGGGLFGLGGKGRRDQKGKGKEEGEGKGGGGGSRGVLAGVELSPRARCVLLLVGSLVCGCVVLRLVCVCVCVCGCVCVCVCVGWLVGWLVHRSHGSLVAHTQNPHHDTTRFVPTN